jgi:prepilin-type N-terminal cleavage/methylation domain-containing protein
MNGPSEKGLTLVELLVVLAILGILVGTTSFLVAPYLSRARDVAASAELEAVQTAMRAYMVAEEVDAVPTAVCVQDLDSAEPALAPGYLKSRAPRYAYSWDSAGNVSQCGVAGSEQVSIRGAYYIDYYDHDDPFPDSAQLALERTEEAIQFDWGLWDAPVPNEKYSDQFKYDWFGARWTIDLPITEAGTYEFRTKTDDGVRLRVDGELVIDEWQPMYEEVHTAVVSLDKGMHTVQMDYFEQSWGAMAMLSWSRVGE